MNTSTKMTWLLKREMWEHKGGFFWAPIVSGIIFLVITVMAIIAGETVRREVDGGDSHVRINNVDLNQLTKTLDAKELAELGGGIDLSILLAGSWPFIVLAFVVFFYCLGALYDERKDRSILFWKSLPLSDGQTVASKVASALGMAPLFAAAAAVLTAIGFLIILSGYALFHGGNPIELIWGPASPISVLASLFVTLPIYALWALPTVGWLLLVSAWSRSKPFLWALLVPIFSGVLVSWFDIMHVFGMKAEWFWVNIVGRLLTGTVPGMDLVYRAAKDPAMRNYNVDGPQDIVSLFSIQNAFSALGSIDLWVGVAAGLAMIFAAIHFRRSRDEG